MAVTVPSNSALRALVCGVVDEHAVDASAVARPRRTHRARFRAPSARCHRGGAAGIRAAVGHAGIDGAVHGLGQPGDVLGQRSPSMRWGCDSRASAGQPVSVSTGLLRNSGCQMPPPARRKVTPGMLLIRVRCFSSAVAQRGLHGAALADVGQKADEQGWPLGLHAAHGQAHGDLFALLVQGVHLTPGADDADGPVRRWRCR